MTTFSTAAGIILLAFLSAVAEDSITAVKVQGGPPAVGQDGKPLAREKTPLVELKGTNAAALLSGFQEIVPLLNNERIWWDVPPDGGYVSIAVQWNGQDYTLNSCYPLYKAKATIAVTDIGLVAVSSRREKLAREAQNPESFKALLRFFDTVLDGTAP
jgi:hypothetical protein